MSSTPPRHDDDHATAASSDPSMEDILASIRRILNEDETNAPAGTDSPLAIPPAPPPRDTKDDVLLLDPSMMVGAEPAPSKPAPQRQLAPQLPTQPAVQSASGVLVAPEAAASATAAVSALVQALVAERTTPVHRTGPTIEDLVREELRPMLKAWLDQHLPPLVERLVRIEIERVVGRAL